MTDDPKPQSPTELDNLTFRELLMSISNRMEDTQDSVQTLFGRVRGLEQTVENGLTERAKLLKTDLEARILQESTERKIESAYQKAKLELYDNEFRDVKLRVDKAQERSTEEFKDVRNMIRNQGTEQSAKIDVLQTSVSDLKTKVTLLVGTIVFIAEVAAKVVPELLK